MKKLLLCLVFLSAFGISLPAHAVEADEAIRSFDSAVRITSDNTAHVRETIVYDFGVTSHHGIFRFIPIDYTDGEINYFITARYQNAVDEKSDKIKAQTYEENGNLVIKLGDPDKTITGIHTYTIHYTLSPVVMKKDGQPFLNLNVLGEDWKVPIDNFSATVSLENGLQLRDVKWYDADSVTPQVVKQDILPGQSLTINAFLPDGYVTTFLEPNTPRPFDVWKFIGEYLVLILVALGFGIAGIIVWLRWWHAHRKRKSQTIIPEYEAPKGMTPAQVGLLDDDTADMREVTATVIDWAVHGYLKITQIEKKGWFGSRGYRLTRLKPSKELSAAERKLFDAFFSKGEEVELKDLDKSKMAVATIEYKSAIKDQLSTKGFYDKKGNIIEKGNLTDVGAKQWAKVEGFQLYMSVAEKDRLNFSDGPERTPERFNKLLPFAVALGVEKEWAKQFEGIDVSSSTSSWYVGNMAAFSAVNLTNDISTSFASTVSSNSSVSSSGGSSGGGVGGGGGGSW